MKFEAYITLKTQNINKISKWRNLTFILVKMDNLQLSHNFSKIFDAKEHQLDVLS